MSQMSKQSFRVCFCFRRIFKLQNVEPPQDIRNLFNQYSKDGTMTIDDLQEFLIEFQGEENATKEEAQNIFNSMKHLNIFHRRGLHLEAFFRYLLGDLNSPLPPSRLVHHDMNAPLAHYFLYTGHNSYLTGNQLSSDCSVEPIIKALQKGVRVIELDLWPNSSKGNVEVRHGGTLTTPEDLGKCLRAIKDHAFSASEYPVVITFEDHLTPDLQEKVAKMVTKTFGRMLYTTESDYPDEFPSPESLKRKVMISTKPPKEYLESEGIKEKGKSQKSKHLSKEEVERTESKQAENQTRKIQRDEGESYEDEDEENEVPKYRNLIAIHAVKIKGESASNLNFNPDRVSRLSMSEQQLENIAKTHGSDIIRFTQRNLLRVYPKGTRFDSSNYNPFVGWMHGAQMVAFNMQGYGKYLWMMQGMFKANGECGYVKKPDFLLEVGPNNEVFDPHAILPVKKILRVKVYLGEGWHSDFRRTHFDRYSPPDFFVKIGIVGHEHDMAKMQTRIIEDEWVPVWNEEFEFQLSVPELALLRIEVLEYDTSKSHDFGGQTCLPVSELRSGIRAVPLCNRKGEKYKSVRLLMGFRIQSV